MISFIRNFLISILAIAGILCYSTVKAEIKIDKFESTITINPDASLNVTENIICDFGSEVNKHGIYRDIPVRYENEGGFRTIKLSNFRVTDGDGVPYKFAESFIDNNKRLKIGDADVTVNGEKNYVISYKVERAINFFDSHDELYWNVTGNGWPFKMYNVSARVNLPAPLPESVLKKECFAGPYGVSEKCTSAEFSVVNGKVEKVEFLQAKLGSAEGLTVVVGLPKKQLVEPRIIGSMVDLARDNYILVLPLAVLILMWYRWQRMGKDPEGRKTIIHHYDVPDNLSPSEAGLILDERVDNYDISADIIDLAVKGYIKINRVEQDKTLFKKTDYILERLRDADAGLGKSESMLFEKLFFSSGSSAGLKKEVAMSDLQEKFYKDLAEIKKEVYASMTGKGYFAKSPEAVRRNYLLLGLGLLFAGFLVMGIFGYLGTISFAASGIITIIFSFFMPARTLKGVLAKEHLLGLKRYLTVAEKDRLEFHNAPEKNPDLFEKLLPYAMAFKVEKAWARQFEGIYNSPPQWYNNPYGGAFNAALFASDMHSFSTRANSTMSSVPSSASSGGSGFSGGGAGGGFGGGGGGSW